MSEQQLWNQIKKTLQNSLNGKLLHSVLNTVTLESFISKGQKHFTLNVPSAYHQKILNGHLSNIQTQIKTQGIPYKTINIKRGLCNIEQKKEAFCSPVPSLLPQVPTQKKSAYCVNWTFSSFIQGPGNCFAYSLAKSIAKQPFKNNSNPLFIYGPSGIGKTHLLHAIGNTLEEEKPHLNVRYLPAERFFNDCINHIRKNEMSRFRQKYRTNINVLLLDDVQILGKGESTQEEFFHTFESLKQGGCQIVLASDQKPKNIKGLKDRIKTRFEGGIIADIQLPDKDTKTAIIRNKSQKLLLNISEEIISYLSDIPTGSIRELEGHLNKIKMFCELQKTAFSLRLAQQLFSEDFSTPLALNIALERPISTYPLSSSKEFKIRNLQKEVCSRFHLKLSALKSKSRKKHLVQARNLAIYIARKELKFSLVEIGHHFGNRNHSTILNSIKNIESQQQKDINLTKNIQEIQTLIHKKK